FHEIPLAVPCSDELSVTADSQWGACQSEHGIEVFGLSGQSKGQSREVMQNPEGEALRTPSWAPDGRHLAAASHLAGGGINIYTVSSAHDRLRLTARLTFKFDEVNSVWWSADGEWLSFLGGSASGGSRLYLVHVGPLLSRLFGHEDSPVTLDVAQDLIRDVNGLPPVVWAHVMSTVHSTTVTVADSNGRGIVQQNMVTGQRVTLLTEQVGYICGLAWTPDNSRLVFVLCGPSSIEINGPPAVLYTYTPPN
ncbi:MAG: WD40 repeat domain-containing protein, partial [Ktedonobacterales bacterium]